MASQASRIVVGVDNEGHSDAAVRAAFGLAGALKSRVELLHVAEVPHPLWQHLSEGDLATARSRAEARLAGLLSGVGVDSRMVSECLTVRPGAPARELLAQAQGASWIFVGGHHRKGALDFGNNLRALLGQTPCPVWVQGVPPAPVQRVLAALDLSPHSPAVVRTASALAAALGVPLELVHVFTRPDLGYVLGYAVPFPEEVVTRARETAQGTLADTARRAADARGTPATRFLDGDAATELIGLTAPGDLLVLGTQGATALMATLVGGVARAVLAAARGPLVLVRS